MLSTDFRVTLAFVAGVVVVVVVVVFAVVVVVVLAAGVDVEVDVDVFTAAAAVVVVSEQTSGPIMFGSIRLATLFDFRTSCSPCSCSC